MGRGLLGHFIWRILSLADDAFQVHFHDFFKEKPAGRFDMVKVEDS